MRPTAPKAFLRPAQKSWRSAPLPSTPPIRPSRLLPRAKHAPQVVVGWLGCASSTLHCAGLRCDDFNPQHVGGGDAVDEGGRAPRVPTPVAADGAGPLAGGVWHVVEPARVEGVAQVQVDQS